jgi:glycosyltransferase involved in cell wall biosynthesis
MIDEPHPGTQLHESERSSRNGANGTHLPPPLRQALKGDIVHEEPSGPAEPPILALFCFEPPGSGVAGRVEPLLTALAGRDISLHLFVPRALPLAIPGATIHVVGECRALDLIAQVQEFGRRAANTFLKLFRDTAAPITLMGCDWSAVPPLTLLRSIKNLDVLLCVQSLERQRSDMTAEISKQIEEIEVSGLRTACGILAWEPAAAECARTVCPSASRRILDVPALFPTDAFSACIDPGAVKARYDIGPVDPTIVYIGDLREHYGPELLVKAMPAVLKRHSQARLVVVGDGDMYWPLRVYSRYLLLDHAVRFAGSLQGTALHELVQAADVIAVPSRQPTPDWPILAAWAARRPVVATHEASPDLLVHDHNSVLVYPTVDSCAWGIDTVLSEPERALGQASKGHERLMARYGWNGLAAQVHELMDLGDESAQAPRDACGLTY